MGRIGALAVCLALGMVSQAEAHFLFTRICPAAEGGRFAEVYFSEYATAGDPRYIEKVAPAQFQLQAGPGSWRPLAMRRLPDRLRGRVPTTGSLVVSGKLDYGVLDRPGAAPFLLRHYTKAVAGAPADLNRMAPAGTPIELLASFEPERVVLRALLDGKPLANTRIDIVDADLAGEEITTDADGHATFSSAAPGLYCAYVGHTLPEAGEHAGKKHQEVKQFATLSFSWPPASAEPDEEAVNLFEEALSERATWQNFPGFQAELAADLDGRPASGSVQVAADGSVQIDLGEDAAMAPWIEEQLASITMHRSAGQHASGPGQRPVLRLADTQTDHPFGRLLEFVGGRFASSYRVKDQQLLTVNRLIDGQNLTITVLDNDRNTEGKFLPRTYAVQYWDDATGQLLRSETVQQRWTRVGAWDLPAEHTVSTSSADGVRVRTFRLTKHAIADE